MFGALFRNLLLVDEYYNIQIFYDSDEKVFFVLDGDEFDDENKISVTRIDSEKKYYSSMYETYIEKEEK